LKHKRKGTGNDEGQHHCGKADQAFFPAETDDQFGSARPIELLRSSGRNGRIVLVQKVSIRSETNAGAGWGFCRVADLH
jgi:hypothetical protein